MDDEVYTLLVALTKSYLACSDAGREAFFYIVSPWKRMLGIWVMDRIREEERTEDFIQLAELCSDALDMEKLWSFIDQDEYDVLPLIARHETLAQILQQFHRIHAPKEAVSFLSICLNRFSIEELLPLFRQQIQQHNILVFRLFSPYVDQCVVEILTWMEDPTCQIDAARVLWRAQPSPVITQAYIKALPLHEAILGLGYHQQTAQLPRLYALSESNPECLLAVEAACTLMNIDYGTSYRNWVDGGKPSTETTE